MLIVEDEPLVAFDNEWHLADAGYRIAATVDNVVDALAALESHRIDLLVADVRLACGGSGVAVAERAHARSIPALYATGGCPEEGKRFALGCLIKPFGPRDLVRALGAVDAILQGRAPRNPPPALRLYDPAA